MPNLHQLTGVELDRARDAANYLLTVNAEKVEILEPILNVKLDTLRADLTSEQEDRRKLAAS
jgi:hypothetical protein